MGNLEAIEPTSDTRMAANAIAQTYVALIQEGFSSGQALYLVGQSIRGAIAAGGDTPSSD
jgi:uncharacterized protein YoaH (UPF0181 family)